MRRAWWWPLVMVGLLGGCATGQLQSYQDRIAGACAVAIMLSPVAGPYAPWIVGACSTEAAIAKLALDPSSLAWLQDLVRKVRGG